MNLHYLVISVRKFLTYIFCFVHWVYSFATPGPSCLSVSLVSLRRRRIMHFHPFPFSCFMAKERVDMNWRKDEERKILFVVIFSLFFWGWMWQLPSCFLPSSLIFVLRDHLSIWRLKIAFFFESVFLELRAFVSVLSIEAANKILLGGSFVIWSIQGSPCIFIKQKANILPCHTLLLCLYSFQK